jgi:phosphatidylinositol alpha-1,6-mannosyltransferase
VKERRPGLVLVSAGLGREGGGSAALGRLAAACAVEYGRGRGLPLEILHLGSGEPGLEGLPVRHFAGRQSLLATALIARQCSGPAVLVFDHLGPARVQGLLPPALRAPYALFLLGVELERRLSWDKRRAVEGATLSIAISEHTRGLAMAAALPRGPVEVLYPALEEPVISGHVDQALLDRVGRGHLLIVGRLSRQERYKGHDALLEVLAGVRGRHPSARLVVAGEGDDRPRLEAKARELGLSEAVVFAGFVNEATRAALYEACLAFVMPSRGEGFGLVYLEAMRAGKACVALAGTAAAEIIEDGRTGLLPESADGSLARAIERLLDSPELALELGAAGRRRYETTFSRERFVRGFHDRLDRLRGVA